MTGKDAHHLLAALAAIVLAGALVLAPPARAVEDVQPARAAGETRLETAVAAAGRAHPQGSDRAVIASALRFGDALAGAALAGALDAPVLLTTPERLEPPTADALTSFGVTRVTLLGGESVLQPAVADDLRSMGMIVDRIGADDVYASAADIARAVRAVAGAPPQVQDLSTVAVASGEDFPDALAISGPAHELAMPLLLTQQDAIPETTSTVLRELDPDQILVIGGAEAVSERVAAQLAQGNRATVQRLGGVNRTDTAAVVADHFIDAGTFQARAAVLARGDAFPDAVTAGQVAAFLDAPILLTATQGLLGEQSGAWFTSHCETLELLQVVGGRAAVSVDVANGAEGLAESCSAPDEQPAAEPGADPAPGQTFVVTPQQALQTDAPGVADFTVARRYDGEPLRGPVDLVLFPCEGTRVTGAGADTFADTDADGHADGFATTNTGNARIALVNGEDVEDSTIFLAEPDEDGDIDIRLASQAADCTVLVVVTGNGNGELDLDARNRPVEDYGVGKVTWTAS